MRTRDLARLDRRLAKCLGGRSLNFRPSRSVDQALLAVVEAGYCLKLTFDAASESDELPWIVEIYASPRRIICGETAALAVTQALITTMEGRTK